MVPMLQCGLLRSNFSLAIRVLPALLKPVRERLERVAGIEPASSAWKAAALPLCYTRPPGGLAASLLLLWRVVGEVGLEPAKAYARGFTVPPLCHSGHSPSRAEPPRGLERNLPPRAASGAKSARRQSAIGGPARGAPIWSASYSGLA